MKKLTSALLTLLSIFPCCANRPKVPHLPLTEISYHYGSQMLATPEYDITISQKGDSIFAIRFDQDAMQYGYYLVTRPNVMTELKEVIIKEKIYKYKEHYINKFVLDGDAWGYYAVFSDDVDDRHQHFEMLSSSGSNAEPRGNGLKVLSKTMKKALEGAQFLYTCDREGKKIEPEEYETETSETKAETAE